MEAELIRLAKEALVSKIEGLARLRTEHNGRTFVPYTEPLKEALMQESYYTLKSDYEHAREVWRAERGY